MPTHEHKIAAGKSVPIATFNLIFLGLGWPWVEYSVGFTIIFTCFRKSQAPYFFPHNSFCTSGLAWLTIVDVSLNLLFGEV